MPERVALRIKNVAKAVLVSGQAYQDPKDALNEFISNAADEYIESGRRGEQVRMVLRRRGQRSFIAVEDFGRGMDPDRLKAVAQGLSGFGAALMMVPPEQQGPDRDPGEVIAEGCQEILSRPGYAQQARSLATEIAGLPTPSEIVPMLEALATP